MSRAPHLVLGLGNELLTDEGVGVVAARRLGARDLPGVEVVDGGTLGLGLVPLLEDREGVLVFDAVQVSGVAPGRFIRLEGPEILHPRGPASSVHHIGLPEAVGAAALAGHAPRRLALVGMVPASVGLGYGLTAEAASAVEEMVERGLEVLAEWGVREVANA